MMTRLPAGRLEAGQECVDVDVRQFLLGGLVPGFDGAVREFEIQIKDQILHVRWRPRRRRLPQATVLQDIFDYITLRRFDEGHNLHFAAALWRRRARMPDYLSETTSIPLGSVAGRLRTWTQD